MKANEGGFHRWLVHIHQHLFNNMVGGESNSFSVVLLPQLSGCYMANILKETYIMKTETLRSYLYPHRPLKKMQNYLHEISYIACVLIHFYKELAIERSLLNRMGCIITWVRGCVDCVGQIFTWVEWVTWVKIFLL